MKLIDTAEQPEFESASARYTRLLGDRLWGLSSLSEPVLHSQVEKHLCKLSGLETLGGMRSYVGRVRSSFADKIFVADSGDVDGWVDCNHSASKPSSMDGCTMNDTEQLTVYHGQGTMNNER